MAVDQLESAVGQFVGQQAAGEADLVVERLQGGTLAAGMRAEVELVGDQVAGASSSYNTFAAVSLPA
jgi:hypothetical protein